MNIRFDYLYRDGSNYKQFESLVFANPDNLTCADIQSRLVARFESGVYFIAEQIGIPSIRFAEANEDDHCWHEFVGIALDDDAPSEDRTIEQFLSDVEAVKQWEEFLV